MRLTVEPQETNRNAEGVAGGILWAYSTVTLFTKMANDKIYMTAPRPRYVATFNGTRLRKTMLRLLLIERK